MERLGYRVCMIQEWFRIRPVFRDGRRQEMDQGRQQGRQQARKTARRTTRKTAKKIASNKENIK